MSLSTTHGLPNTTSSPRVKRVKTSGDIEGRKSADPPAAGSKRGAANLFSKEIFDLIFKYTFDEKYCQNPDFVRILLAVTHLNRASRTAALGIPYLWASALNYFGPRLAMLALQRTKSFPLVIEANVDPPRSPPATSTTPAITSQQVASHMSHIKDLTLVGYSLHSFLPSLTHPAPILETVEFSCLSTKLAVLPVDFLSNNAPNLKLITIQNVSIPPKSLSFPSVQRLEITASSDTFWLEPNVPPISQLLNTLSGMPNLEVLILKSCIPCYDARTRSSWPAPVTLPKLNHLTFRGNADDLTEVWKMLCVPPTITLEIESDQTGDDVTEWLIPELTEFLHSDSRVEGSPIHALEVSQKTPLLDLSVIARCKDSTEDTRQNPQVAIMLLGNSDAHDHDEWIRAQDLCRAFPSHDLTSLSLDIIHPVASQKKTFVDVLQDASSLKELHLRHSAGQAFCSTTMAIWDAYEDDDFLPSLETISLAKVSFRGKVHHDGKSTHKPFHKNFYDWVTRRRDSEMELKSLSIKDCTIDPQWFLDLKSLVADTTWDGVRKSDDAEAESEREDEEDEEEGDEYAEDDEVETDDDDLPDRWAFRRGNMTSDELLDELIQRFPGRSDYDSLMERYR